MHQMLNAVAGLHVWLYILVATSRRAAACRCQELLLARQCVHSLSTRPLLAALQ